MSGNSQIIVDEDNYHINLQSLNLAIQNTGPDREQICFPIRLNIPRLNKGICRRLAIPFMGDEYYGVRICVNMWLWRSGPGNNLAQQPNQNLTHEELDEIKKQIVCPILEIRLWRNGEMVYSCREFRIGDDGFGGYGVVLGPGKLVSIMFEPVSEIPLINRLRERYDDYVLDVEFKSQQEAENKKMEKAQKEKPNITLRTATAQLLTRVYSNDIRRDKFIG
jgi:hypothetical protein